MKLSKKEIKTCRVAYLHSDGHLVIWHSKKDKDAGSVEWVTIWENIGIDVTMPDDRRLIISKGVLPFLVNATRIRVNPPSVESGSDNTRKMGLSVECIELRNGTNEPWVISNFPGVISSDIYSHESNEKFSDYEGKCRWGDLPISKVHREKQD